MNKFPLRAKKSLGQNFLTDGSILTQIIETAQIRPTDTIIEIGAGRGALTKVLATQAKQILALEIDDDLIPELLHTFPLAGKVSIVHHDILKTDITELFKQQGLSVDVPYRVIANIPYYITAPIIQHLLHADPKPWDILLMVQKEVAERITALPGDMSILAVSIQSVAAVEYCFTVPKTAFTPVPKVESAIIRIIPKENATFVDEKLFFRIVKVGFSSKRKTLINNLSNGLRLPKATLFETFQSLGLSLDCRAQVLSVELWNNLLVLLQPKIPSFGEFNEK